MTSTPRNTDPPKPRKRKKAEVENPLLAKAKDWSDPIDAAKWKTKSAVLVMPSDLVKPAPTNGSVAPATTSSQPTTAAHWKAEQDAAAKSGTAAPARARSHRKKPAAAKDEPSSQPTTAAHWKAEHDAAAAPPAPAAEAPAKPPAAPEPGAKKKDRRAP